MKKGSSLSSRLKHLKKDGLTHSDSKSESKTENVLLPGWVKINPLVWRRSVLKKNILRNEFHQSLLIPEGYTSKNLIFYDTETTGLSTGAGTIAFLIGLGRIQKDSFEVIQYFLADYPGEKAMLDYLKRDFPSDSLYVSYNGKSFDSHLITTRFLLNRIECKRGKEIDLLYLSRRLWKNKLENCRLGTIEEHILNITRGPDIPGSEIPDVWFDFLKSGNLDKLKLVFSHNLQDIYSLALLLEKMEDIIEYLPESDNYDVFNLGKTLLQSQKNKALGLISREYVSGNREAAQFLSLFYKREGEWDSAVIIWKKLNKKEYNLFAAVELAKYYEHKIQKPVKALHVIDTLIKGPLKPSADVLEKLLYRKKRLLRKIESRSVLK